MGADHVCARRLVLQELIHPRDGAIEDGDRVAVLAHVEDQVAAHHSEADEPDIGECAHSGDASGPDARPAAELAIVEVGRGYASVMRSRK